MCPRSEVCARDPVQHVPPIVFAMLAGSSCSHCGAFPESIPDDEHPRSRRLSQRCSHCHSAWFCDATCHDAGMPHHMSLCKELNALHVCEWPINCSPGAKGWMHQLTEDASSLPLRIYQALAYQRRCCICNSTDIDALRPCPRCRLDWRCSEHIPSTERNQHYRGDCDNYLDFTSHCTLLQKPYDEPAASIFASEAERQLISLANPAEEIDTINAWITWDDFFSWRFGHCLPLYEENHVARAQYIASTMQATQPLTCIQAIRHFGLYLGREQTFNVHVIGASPEFELYLGSVDAIIAHWDAVFEAVLPKTCVQLVFVGPNVAQLTHRQHRCARIMFSELPYNRYVRDPSYAKPDLAIAFNAAFYCGAREKILASVLRMGVPLAITSRCPIDAKKEEQFLIDDMGAQVTLHPTWTDFPSLVPEMMLGKKDVFVFANSQLICAEGKRQTNDKNVRRRRERRENMWR